MPPQTNMGQVFDRAVRRRPDRTAVAEPDIGVRYTYRELGERVDRAGAGLQEAGVEPGDSVGIVMENRAEVLTVYWATQQLGATFVPLNFRAASDELAFMLDNVSVDVLFFSATAAESVAGAVDAIDGSVRPVAVDDAGREFATAYDEFLSADPDAFDPTWVDGETTSLILHTSGTTGRPKAVPISHAANYARTVGNPANLGWEWGDVTLGITPNFHEMGRAAISSAALLNGTYVAQRDWDPEQALRYVEGEEITILYLVPTLFHDMLNHDDLATYDVSSVEKVGSSGTVMSEHLYEEIQTTYDPTSVVNFYGCSEMDCMAVCSWLGEKPGCVGKAGVNTAVRVVTPKDGETVPPEDTVPAGELGEVIVDAQSPEAFDEYLDRPDANETSFEDGWYFTGDLGYLDDDGDLFIAGRVDDMIISGGENIHPAEVENVLVEHEAVDDVAIGSMADDRWGESVTAFVTASETGDGDLEDLGSTLETFCLGSDKLADFKRPRTYVFVESIPQNDIGKKLRRILRADSLDGIGEITVRAVTSP